VEFQSIVCHMVILYVIILPWHIGNVTERQCLNDNIHHVQKKGFWDWCPYFSKLSLHDCCCFLITKTSESCLGPAPDEEIKSISENSHWQSAYFELFTPVQRFASLKRKLCRTWWGALPLNGFLRSVVVWKKNAVDQVRHDFWLGFRKLVSPDCKKRHAIHRHLTHSFNHKEKTTVC